MSGLAIALLAAAALAPRDAARLPPAGTVEIGVFNPLRLVPVDGLQVELHPLVFLVAPHLTLRRQVLAADTWALAVEGGLALPSSAFSEPPPYGLEGYLTPSCKVGGAEPDRAPESCQAPGTFVVPSAGLVLSHGREHVTTARLDYAAGILVAGERPDPLDTWAPLDLLLAPVFNGHRVHLGLRYDRSLLDWLRLAGEAHLWHVGAGPPPARSPWVMALHLGTDLRTSTHTRLTVGAIYWNSDQREVALVRDADGYSRFERVRSHDFGPTADFLWHWQL